MSFSISASGTPKNAIRDIGKQAANTPECPKAFADAINEQLAALPKDVNTNVSAYGHTGWEKDQLAGEITLHATIHVTAAGESTLA